MIVTSLRDEIVEWSRSAAEQPPTPPWFVMVHHHAEDRGEWSTGHAEDRGERRPPGGEGGGREEAAEADRDRECRVSGPRVHLGPDNGWAVRDLNP